MAEILESGAIIGWESASEIYVEEVVGVNVFEQTVTVTLAVNRVEPGKGVGAKTVRACVARVVQAADGSSTREAVQVANLRCTSAGATSLRDALNGALLMLEPVDNPGGKPS
ncbi:hypothetical protein [Afipia felis]|uniref:hypothetical protein n=1 Tax=Afipia felis TaxID=1035 RepID=UPI00065F8B12|nr:hypothetical protein [Afipia felis]